MTQTPPEPGPLEPGPESSDGDTEKVSFHYIKGHQFRTIHVDGVFGGLTPRGFVQMSVFNERRAIPQRTVHPVRGGIEVLAEDKSLREGRDGYVRELDVNLLFDLHTAETISRWLTAQIQKLKEAISEGERAKEALQDGVKS